MEKTDSSATAGTGNQPFVTKLVEIKESGSPGVVNAMLVHPFAATCILLVLDAVNESKRAALLAKPVMALAQECLGHFVDDPAMIGQLLSPAHV